MALMATSSCRSRDLELSAEPAREDSAERSTYKLSKELLDFERKHLRLVQLVDHDRIRIQVFMPEDDPGVQPSRYTLFEHADEIYAADGAPIKTLEDFVKALERRGRAAETRFDVHRRGRNVTLIYRKSPDLTSE
jgi:hypothetical protein